MLERLFIGGGKCVAQEVAHGARPKYLFRLSALAAVCLVSIEKLEQPKEMAFVKMARHRGA